MFNPHICFYIHYVALVKKMLTHININARTSIESGLSTIHRKHIFPSNNCKNDKRQRTEIPVADALRLTEHTSWIWVTHSLDSTLSLKLSFSTIHNKKKIKIKNQKYFPQPSQYICKREYIKNIHLGKYSSRAKQILCMRRRRLLGKYMKIYTIWKRVFRGLSSKRKSLFMFASGFAISKEFAYQTYSTHIYSLVSDKVHQFTIAPGTTLLK